MDNTLGRYRTLKCGGGFNADAELIRLLNALPAEYRVIHIQSGRYGKYHGLDEEHEQGYMVVVDTTPGAVR